MPFPTALPLPPTLFPTYLVPSNPFRRRRQSSIDSTRSSLTSSVSSTASSSPIEESFLTGHASHLRCARCLSDLALSNQIISKGFIGRHGRAYLVAPSTSAIPSQPAPCCVTAKAKDDALPNLPNTYTHKPVPRQLVTGAHTVGDISCAQCGSVLGWKYIHAEEESQRYKVGKFILETKRVCRSSTWESGHVVDEKAVIDTARRDFLRRRRRSGANRAPPPVELDKFAEEEEEEEIEFDSDDEDECEQMFLGQWTREAAKEIRRAKGKGKGFGKSVLQEW